MQIKLNEDFKNNFETIFRHIAKDKITAAKSFKKELFIQIRNLPLFPYKNRKSIYFDDTDIRDMVFKGYTICLQNRHSDEYNQYCRHFQ